MSRVDLPELVISKSEVQVTEGGTDTYTVALDANPSANVTVTLSSRHEDVATISDETLTFTTTNGTTGQTITVTGADDTDADNEATEIRHTVSIGSNPFMTAVIPVEVSDDDPPGLTLASSHATASFPSDVSEGYSLDGRFGADEDNPFNEGATATYTVALDEEPEGDTTINLSSNDTSALTVSPGSIVFTKMGEASDPNKYEWDDPQTVTLTAVSDSDAEDEIWDVLHKATIGGTNYTLARVRAIIQDTGLPDMTYTPTTREVTIASEGGTATYTIELDADPGADVTVSLTSSDTDSVTVSPGSITFTKTGEASDPDKYEWNDPQTVTVTGVADEDEFDDIAYIRHRTIFDGDMVAWPSVRVTVTDSNRAPYFNEGVTTTREVPEDAGQNANVGDPVAATDLNATDTLTYTLDDPSGLFSISSTTGQITVAADNSLDYEGSEQDYDLAVTVTDRTSNGLTDAIDVKVLVTDVNEAPVITRTTGDDALTFAENTAATTVLRRYRATDVDAGGSITWSVEGTDADGFAIDTNGNLRFVSPPDYEDQTSHSITIVATDNGEPALNAQLPVTVTITDVDEPPAITGSATHDHDENAAHPVQQYSASDPESVSSIASWSLGGRDSGDFTITNGQLQFANTPDFESPADSGGNNVYNVTVRATDNATPPKTGSFDVTVTVKDLNEEPAISGDDTLSFPEGTATARVLDRYSASDPERRPVTWTVAGTDAGAFRIDASGNLYFRGTPDHESPTDSGGDNVYDIQVVATDDGNLGDGTPSQRPAMAGTFDVAVTVTNVDEPPAVSGTTTFPDRLENDASAIHTYRAADPEGDSNITWSLGGTDRGDFDITDGVLTFKEIPDYERPADSGGNNQYEVIVYATDSTNQRGNLHVDVIVVNVDEPPVIAGPNTVDDFPENSATSRQVGRYSAADPEGASVALSLSSGGGDFNLASNGAVSFKESPDFEDRSSYSFTVRAVAGTHTVDWNVAVSILNVEEPGTVTLSAVQPQENVLLTATLEDDDNPTGTTWQWFRASNRGSSGTEITRQTSASYTPVHPDDTGSYLRVVASYNDGFSNNKTATAVSAYTVREEPGANRAPEFPSTADYTRSIRENLTARNLGAPVTATDANSADHLTYSIPMSGLFEIVDSTGQLRTKVALDHEADEEHTITVTATDPGGLTDTVSVTITVVDVDETPEISGPNDSEVAENSGTSVATYTATDPDDTGIDWALAGTDSDAFTLSDGVLTFNAVPDYEEKSSYRITVEARERSPGTSVDRHSVTVRITNIDEPGMVDANVQEPRVGQTLRLEVVDEDDGESVNEWKWERGDPNSPCGTGANWQTIVGATGSSYTPSAADQGKCLRVTAFYSDRAGTGRTEQFITPETVEFGPYFDSDTSTASAPENSAVGRNIRQFRARHSNSGESLTYSLRGSGASYFDIDNNGQLKTSARPLDYETLADHQAVVEITASDNDGETAAINVTITVTDECASAGEPPCAPRISPASATSLRVSWSAPSADSHDLQYREADAIASWTEVSDIGAGRSYTISQLTTGTAYEVQVRTINGGVPSEWSGSGTGTPRTPTTTTTTTTTTTPPTTTTTNTGGGGGSSGGGFVFAGGGFPPVAPPRPATSFQGVGQLFQPLTSTAALGRVWRLIESSQRWLFYDPHPELAPFNTLRTVNLTSDPPAVVILQVGRAQRFRGMPLYAGWNFVPVTSQPLTISPGAGARPIRELVRPLADSGILQRVWWLDSRTQEWQFYDPDPHLAPFNTLKEVDLAANPSAVLAISVDRRTEFRGRTLYRGWNYVVIR